MRRSSEPGPPCCGAVMRRVFSAPAVQTNDTFHQRYFQSPGVKPPKGGWESRQQLRAALNRAGTPGAIDSKPLRVAAEMLAQAPPAGTEVKKEDIEAIKAVHE